jgi:hypothetical protein
MKVKITAITASVVTPPAIPLVIMRTTDVVFGSEDGDEDGDEDTVEDAPASEDFVEVAVDTGNERTGRAVVVIRTTEDVSRSYHNKSVEQLQKEIWGEITCCCILG